MTWLPPPQAVTQLEGLTWLPPPHVVTLLKGLTWLPPPHIVIQLEGLTWLPPPHKVTQLNELTWLPSPQLVTQLEGLTWLSPPQAVTWLSTWLDHQSTGDKVWSASSLSPTQKNTLAHTHKTKPTQDLDLNQCNSLEQTWRHNMSNWISFFLHLWCPRIVLRCLAWCIWLSAKRCAFKGLCTSVENKTLLKTVFIGNIVLCTCMIEWIYSTDNFSNQALVAFKIQSSHTEKVPKNDAKNRHPCTEWFSSLFLQTNRKHMQKQSLICTWKTLFYTDNITSTLTIVVFSINWSRMFALYVRQMCCKLKLKTLNNWKMTASLRNNRKRRVCSNPCICTTQRYSFFFQRSFAWNLKNISPIVWHCCNIRHPYKISNILYKTNEKAVSFLSTTSGTSRDLSRVPSFFGLHGKSLFGNTERCVVVSFSGATAVQWSDEEHALCAFSGVCWDYFQVFCWFGCAKWKYCEKWHLPALKMMMMSWCLMSSDVIWHIRDKLWPMPKHSSIKSTYIRCMRV